MAGGAIAQAGSTSRAWPTPPRSRGHWMHAGDDMLVMEREYFSQSIDTAALEPDNGNCWFDAATATLHLVVATQSPQEVAEAGAHMLAASRLGVKHLVLHPCYTVGYGSKDHTPFPFYALMAGLYGDGRPVRLANDRYEQFQSSAQAPQLPHALSHRGRPRQRQVPDLPGRHGRRRRRSPELLAVGVPGGGDRGAVDLLLPAKRPGQHGDRLARARRRLGARLRHAAEHGRDRDAGRRGRRPN